MGYQDTNREEALLSPTRGGEMEAKDTVMSKSEMQLYCAKAYKDAGVSDISPYTIDMTCPPILCKIQAEISFEAGKKEGRDTMAQEVAEWISKVLIPIAGTEFPGVDFNSYARQILSILEREGYVKLPPDSAILEGIHNLANIPSED